MLVKVTSTIAVGQSNSGLDFRHQVEALFPAASLPSTTPQATLSKTDAPFLGLKREKKKKKTKLKGTENNQQEPASPDPL